MAANSANRITVSAARYSKPLLVSILTAMVALIAASASGDSKKKEEKNVPKFVKVKIGHRVHLDFQEELTVKMNEINYIGDTNLSFEVTAFYPHFAIVDSTNEVLSLSDEVENPAFKIVVYEDDEPIDETWAFYGLQVPHYSRTSLVSFHVMAFEYREIVYEQEKLDGDGKNDRKAEANRGEAEAQND